MRPLTKKPIRQVTVSTEAMVRLAAIEARRLEIYKNPSLTSAFGASEQCLAWFTAYLSDIGIKY